MITLETEILFKDDPWSVPQPNIETGHTYLKTEERIVWYAVLHIEESPIMTNCVYNVVRLMGEKLSKSCISHVLAKLEQTGYFTRWKPESKGRMHAYRYTPTDLFIRVRNDWRRGVV